LSARQARRLASIGPGSLLYARDRVADPLIPKEISRHLGRFAD
jgi:hypothetical protein